MSERVMPEQSRRNAYGGDREENVLRATDKETREIRMSNGGKLAFCSPETFGSRYLNEDSIRSLPRMVEMIFHERLSFGGYTYRKTKAVSEWHIKMGGVISEYVASRPGKATCERLGITDYRSLSPNQALFFVLHAIHDLTRYTMEDIVIDEKSEPRDFISGSSRADKTDAISLLREGLQNFENDAWDGNGVCRNITDMTKALFESLKSLQTDDRLKNVYCIAEIGNDFDEIGPPEQTQRLKKIGAKQFVDPQQYHAWNSFFYIGEDGAECSIVDATWAETRQEKLVHFDYTKTRATAILHRILAFGKIPDPELTRTLMNAYAERFDELAKDTNDFHRLEKMDYIVWNFLTAFPLSVPVEDVVVPARFLRHLEARTERRYNAKVRGGVEEWKMLLRTVRASRQLGFSTKRMFEIFFKKHAVREARKFIQSERLKPGETAAFVEEISQHDGFSSTLASNPIFRMFVRSVHPEMLYPFRPDKDESDVAELRVLIKRSFMLKKLVRNFLRSTKGSASLNHLKKEDATDVLRLAEDALKTRNPSAFKTAAHGMNRWNILYQFRDIWKKCDERAS